MAGAPAGVAAWTRARAGGAGGAGGGGGGALAAGTPRGAGCCS
jgi:hypothetical protein